MNKIYIVGIGPGNQQQMTPEAVKAVQQSDVVIGYTYYLELLGILTSEKEVISTGMKKERDRAARAFEKAAMGKTVAMISSGDAGIYGMASLLWEMKEEKACQTELEVVPGISAMLAAAARLGAPLGHDFCSVSLSDLLTPWLLIEQRIAAAASADFVTAVYNPVSKGRFWQLMRLKEIFLEYRSPETPVGIARQVGREGEQVWMTELKDIQAEMADMFSVLIIGNSQSRRFEGHFYTPRGYSAGQPVPGLQPGRGIMKESFRTILEELGDQHLSAEELWITLHAIHTTADMGMAGLLELTPGVVDRLHQLFYSGNPPVVVTDVTMVGSGIRKALVEKLGIRVLCYLCDPRTEKMALDRQITRTQAGIRLAVEEHPEALFAFGNAPTALMELVRLIRQGKANPMGVIGAPVGFVHVKESKWQLKYGCPDIPRIIVSGRKGGSNVAATIINAILSWEDAGDLNPGRGI